MIPYELRKYVLCLCYLIYVVSLLLICLVLEELYAYDLSVLRLTQTLCL